MKRILLILFVIGGFFQPRNVSAQTFGFTGADTVTATVSGPGGVMSGVKNNTGSNIVMKWHVIASDFPASWLTSSAFGICDNSLCRFNMSNILWDASTSMGNNFFCTYYANATHDSIGSLYLSLDFSGAAAGSHWVTIALTDTTAAFTKNITFIINKVVSNVPNFSGSVNDIKLYPNPAHDELNIVYDAAADVKNIAVYSIIGKIVAVYKVTDNSSANLNLENIPSGVYFVRLANSHGEMVATRKFTRQ